MAYRHTTSFKYGAGDGESWSIMGRKKKVCVYISGENWGEARKLGLNLSQLFDAFLTQQVGHSEMLALRAEQEAALERTNHWFQEHERRSEALELKQKLAKERDDYGPLVADFAARNSHALRDDRRIEDRAWVQAEMEQYWDSPTVDLQRIGTKKRFVELGTEMLGVR